jgi:hypothetical protein
MIYSPIFPKIDLQEKLTKLRKLNYNKFRWWRMFENINSPLPNKSPLLDKILNGDFDYSHYKLQAELVEYELNELAEKCGGNNELFNEKSSLLRVKRKRLLDDFERDENEKLKQLFKEFYKNFTINEGELENEMLRFVGTLHEFYYYMGARYQKIHNPNKNKKKTKKHD